VERVGSILERTGSGVRFAKTTAKRGMHGAISHTTRPGRALIAGARTDSPTRSNGCALLLRHGTVSAKLHQLPVLKGAAVLKASHSQLGDRFIFCEALPHLIFTENESQQGGSTSKRINLPM
jgi:hypothetical protein